MHHCVSVWAMGKVKMHKDSSLQDNLGNLKSVWASPDRKKNAHQVEWICIRLCVWPARFWVSLSFVVTRRFSGCNNYFIALFYLLKAIVLSSQNRILLQLPNFCGCESLTIRLCKNEPLGSQRHSRLDLLFFPTYYSLITNHLSFTLLW